MTTDSEHGRDGGSAPGGHDVRADPAPSKAGAPASPPTLPRATPDVPGAFRDDLDGGQPPAPDHAPAPGDGARRRAERSGDRAAEAPTKHRRRWRLVAFPTLAAQIVAANVIGLALVVTAVLFLSQFRADLIDQRIDSLITEADLIAISVAESAAGEQNERERHRYNRVKANEVLRRLSLPTGLRAQIYDKAGRLTGDTRTLLQGERYVEVRPLETLGPLGGLGRRIDAVFDRAMAPFLPQLELYRETTSPGVSFEPLVWTALAGGEGSIQRVNSEDELILSVSVPIQSVRTVLGALVLSTEGGDIDAAVREERATLILFLIVACGGMAVVSLLLARSIATPIRQLAMAAEKNAEVGSKPLETAAFKIPDLSDRPDEIGYLSTALTNMTNALSDRIGAIETFAADVAHEIKNPLTSLRSAVEVMRNIDDPTQRAKLLAVIQNDVSRLDRLVTDISNASRLDADLVREQRSRFDMRGLLATVVDIAQPKAAEAKVSIKLEAMRPGDLPPAQGLEERLAQVFHNLIDNAISFSPPGGTVTVSAQRDRLQGRAAILVEVADEGPGVPEENLESIFRRFYSNRPEGEDFGRHSGLGLSIGRQIVEAHGGRIWAENRSDRSGALFLTLIPI